MRWTGYAQITIDGNGNGTGLIIGPRVGYALELTGGTVRGNAAGAASLALYQNIEAEGTLLVALQVGSLNNLSGDGKTYLHGGESVVCRVTGGAKGGTVSIVLTGDLVQQR